MGVSQVTRSRYWSSKSQTTGYS